MIILGAIHAAHKGEGGGKANQKPDLVHTHKAPRQKPTPPSADPASL